MSIHCFTFLCTCIAQEWDPFGKLSEIELCKEKRALLKNPTSFSVVSEKQSFSASRCLGALNPSWHMKLTQCLSQAWTSYLGCFLDVASLWMCSSSLVSQGQSTPRSSHVPELPPTPERYLEFQGLKSARVLTPDGLFAVPLTKSEIFQDTQLSKAEKRTLMRFITSIQPFVGSLAFQSAAQLGVDQARKVKGPSEPDASVLGVDLQEPWQRFLERQQLSQRLQEFITYSICLWDWSQSEEEAWPQLSCGEALRRLGSFVSSLGMYGRGTSMPLLYPMYGVAEIAQGFTRMSALHRGTYALRTRPTHILAKKGESGWQATGVVTHRGEVVRASTVIGSCDHITEDGTKDPVSNLMVCRRVTVLLNRPLLGEEGVNLCVVPPSSFSPPLQNVVQVLQLDWSTGTCPRGWFVHHLSQAWIGDPGSNAFVDLDKVVEVLSARCPDATCLFRCRYLHRPRPTERWNSEGSAMKSCSCVGSLAVVADPAAVPQLVVSEEVHEARQIFLASPAAAGAGAEDFLRKPEHVAEELDGCSGSEGEGEASFFSFFFFSLSLSLFYFSPLSFFLEEERGGVMEELELFNEQMQDTEQREVGTALAPDAPREDDP